MKAYLAAKFVVDQKVDQVASYESNTCQKWCNCCNNYGITCKSGIL